MKNSSLRTDKTCRNCYGTVENRFCSMCGQENTETRKTFRHLVFHFFEDLTHYENSFWHSIKYLIFRPCFLTKEYLDGKRKSYLDPIRLYIFISFITFFTISLFPENKVTENYKKPNSVSREKDSIDFINIKYNSIAALDSVQKTKQSKDRLSSFEYWVFKKIIFIKNNNTKQEISNKFKESFVHNFPKVLFIYMPIFAMVMWVFNNKKKWIYFDHAILTLHYFSFLLLLFFINTLLTKLFSLTNSKLIIDWLGTGKDFVLFGWMLYYFFPLTLKFYGGTRIKSAIKNLLILVLNLVLVSIILILFVFYTFINLH
jgi:hypothetical protein